MTTKPQCDTPDSVRLSRCSQRPTMVSSSFDLSTTEPSSAFHLYDLDIDALDKKFNQLSSEFHKSMQDLRADPDNLAKKESILRTKEKLDKVMLWTTQLNTDDGRRLLEEYKENINKQKYEIDKVLKVAKAQTAIDICFMMDCTRSIKRYIKAVENDIINLAKFISTHFNTMPRLAFIGYSDIDHEENNLVLLNFTTDINTFQQFLANVSLVNGHDHCEDVFSGLEAVPKLQWSSPNRILVHICDAPCHGTTFYDKERTSFKSKGTWDYYPNGDPHERDVNKILLNIKHQDIRYFAIQLTKFTVKMFKEFEVIYGPILSINAKNPSDLMEIILKTATETIMTSMESTMSIFNTTERRKNYKLIDIEPKWSEKNTYSVLVTEFISPKTIEDLFEQLLIGSGQATMKIASNPFAQGRFRYAYYGKFHTDNSPILDVVYKELISADPKYNTLTAYKQHLEIHTIAQFLANLFNEAQREIFCKPVEIIYADASIVQQIEDPTKIYQVEARLNQRIQKWNNNCGGIYFEDYSTVLQAFSHWTHHQTAGRLMVVDLQGVRSSEGNKYLLTDPAIHFNDIGRYREARTNLGIKGMREFFRTHVCSQVCGKLGLEKVINEIDQNIMKELYRTTEVFTIKEENEEQDKI